MLEGGAWNAEAYLSGLVFLLPIKGPDSSVFSLGIVSWADMVYFENSEVFGSRLIVGIAQSRRKMLSQKGSQRLALMVKAAKVGPMKETI